MDCIFCKIAAGQVPVTPVYRDDDLIVINDINPQSPHHLLVMPVRHVENVVELADGDPELVGKLFRLAAKIGREQAGSGFRLVVNTGAEGGQTVDHVHVHVLAGRLMGWPPG
jgi:histidine triad (HIT) family protein